jgi:transcriptional regulator with XRE-family HTH domain
MAIKQAEPLSRADFDEAMVRLRLSVSEVAKETGIPRTYLSEYRNGDRKLRPENLAKLRDYFEAKGIEFDDPEPTSAEPPEVPAGKGITPHPRLVAVQSVRFCFPLAESVPDDVVAKVMDQIEEGDARLLALFKENIERESGLFGPGDFTDEFTAMLQEAFSILASNYVLSRMLRGWTAFGVKPVTDDPKTLRDVLAETFAPILTDAGLFAPQASEAAEEEEQAA